jgi:putative peptidoglycan lipid II flippase
VPETLIGTAIGTALLPTISEMVAKNQMKEFSETINRVIRVFIALTIPSAVLLSLALPPLLGFAFGFDPAGTSMLVWVTRAFLVGLLSHCLLELGARIFFARQNATIPFLAAALNLVVYIGSGLLLLKPLQAPGVALSDALAFTAQSLFLLIVFIFQNRKARSAAIETLEAGQTDMKSGGIGSTILRTLIGSTAGSLVIWLMFNTLEGMIPGFILGTVAAAAGLTAAIPFILKEIQMVVHL